MRLALDGRNPGFLREHAYLAVLFITDEDDASAAASCDPPTDDLADYADFLTGLEPSHPERVMVGAIAGNPSPCATGPYGIRSSCLSESGSARPAVRLAAFLDLFPNRASFTSICSQNLSDALTTLAPGISRPYSGASCFQGPVDQTDVDPVSPGLQLQCAVTESSLCSEEARALPRCIMLDDGTPELGQRRPCWYVFANGETGQQCEGYPTGLAFTTLRHPEELGGLLVEAQCKLEE